MTRVLAIDTGTTSGAACDGATDAAPRFWTWHGNRWSSPGEFGARLYQFDEWVNDLVTMTQPDAIAFEAPLVARGSNLMTNADTVRLLYGLAAVVELVAHRLGIRCFECNVATVKKQFAGSGRADKADMMFRARQLGWNVSNSHEADAAALWFVAKATLCKGWRVPVLGGARP